MNISSPSLFSRLKQWLESHPFLDAYAQEQQSMERYLSQAGSLGELEQRQRRWEREGRASRQYL